jgi:hypothetical protein
MPYCVHCGVELEHSQRACPLCTTPVIDPNNPWTETADPAHPERVDTAIDRIDRRYARRLSKLLMLVPMLTVTLLDLLGSLQLTWSPYVTGALICLYCWILVPIFYKFDKPYTYVIIDILALCLYLLLIALMTDGMGWYLSLALPMLLLIGLFVLAALSIYRRIQLSILYRNALFLLLMGLFLIALEVLIDLAADASVALNWSVYAAIPLGVIALMCVYIERHVALKNEIRKRLFL